MTSFPFRALGQIIALDPLAKILVSQKSQVLSPLTRPTPPVVIADSHSSLERQSSIV
jgi:hypothetical protein